MNEWDSNPEPPIERQRDFHQTVTKTLCHGGRSRQVLLDWNLKPVLLIVSFFFPNQTFLSFSLNALYMISFTSKLIRTFRSIYKKFAILENSVAVLSNVTVSQTPRIEKC